MPSNVRDLVRRSITGLVRPLGLRVFRAATQVVYRHELTQALAELHALAADTILAGLPPREGRIELMANLIGTNPLEALHLIDRLHRALAVEGDVCEFGVAQGRTSALIANEIQPGTKNLWLFDSFQGLPKPTEKDELIHDIYGLKSMAAYEGTMAYPQAMAKAAVVAAGLPPERLRIVAGFIEESIKTTPPPEKVCFAYVDFDFHRPILTALELLDGRTPSGAWIVVDDYGYFSSGAKKAVDEFLESRPGRYEFQTPPAYAGHFCMLRKL